MNENEKLDKEKNKDKYKDKYKEIGDRPKAVRSEKPHLDEHYIRPVKAEKKIKIAAGVKQTVWVSGVCGSGKTSFIADYLKNRIYDYYSAREVIPAQVEIPQFKSKGSIVVIDDLHGILDGELQNEWMELIREMITREDIWLIIIARSGVPSWLHSISVQHVFCQIGEEELFFTLSQSEEYFRLWNIELDEALYKNLHEIGRGSPLWFRIYAIELTEHRDQGDEYVLQKARESIWRYWNTHVYDFWDTELCTAMMKLSLVDSFDMDMAVFLTGNNNANILIKNALELGNFIYVDGNKYSIRGPMRFSMLQRLRENYNIEYINGLYTRAGDCLMIKDEPIGALTMYEKAHNDRSIAELLIQNARQNPSTGHYYEMRNYYRKLPEEYIKQSVELMGAMCMLQSILMNIDESERWYDELVSFAKKQKGSLKREADNKLLYLDIALPHRGSVGIGTLIKNAGMLLLNHTAKLPEFSVTSNLPSQMNGGKDFCEWSKKDKEIASSLGKVICLVLGKYGKGLVSLALAESGFEKGEDNYEVECLAVRGRMEAEAGGKLEQCFVGVGIIFWLSIFTNHTENAKVNLEGFLEMVQKEKVSPALIKNYNALNCRLALYLGQTAGITKWMEEAPRENEEFYVMDRFRYLTKVRVYLADHKYEEAKLLLQKLEYYAQIMKRTYIAMETKLLQAILFYRLGEDRWRGLLQEVITEAEDYHFVRLLTREGAALLPLLKKEKLEWKNMEFKKQVEKELSYMAQIYPAYLNTGSEDMTITLPDNAIKILKLQALGRTTDEIAKELSISVATVKYHNKENYKKLGVQTKAQAINEAKNRHLI